MAVIGQSGQLHGLEKGTRYTLKRRLDGPRTRMDGCCGKGKKNLLPYGELNNIFSDTYLQSSLYINYIIIASVVVVEVVIVEVVVVEVVVVVVVVEVVEVVVVVVEVVVVVVEVVVVVVVGSR